MQTPSFELHCYSSCQVESSWPVALAKQFWAMCQASAKNKWLCIAEASESQQLKSSVGRTSICEWRVVWRSPEWGKSGHVSKLHRSNNMGKYFTLVFFPHKIRPPLSCIIWQNIFCDCWKYRQGITVFLSNYCELLSKKGQFSSWRDFSSVTDLDIIFFCAHLKLFYFSLYIFALIICFFFLVHSVLGQP